MESIICMHILIFFFTCMYTCALYHVFDPFISVNALSMHLYAFWYILLLSFINVFHTLIFFIHFEHFLLMHIFIRFEECIVSMHVYFSFLHSSVMFMHFQQFDILYQYCVFEDTFDCHCVPFCLRLIRYFFMVLLLWLATKFILYEVNIVILWWLAFKNVHRKN